MNGPDGVGFRTLTDGDRTDALDLMQAYYAEGGHDFDPSVAADGLARIIGGTAAARFWLIEHDGAVAGYLCVTLGFSLEVGGGDFFLDELYVVPAARGCGLGRAALAFAEREAAALAARRLCLEVERGNPRARALYERQGYCDHDRRLLSKTLG